MLPSGVQSIYKNRAGWAHDRLKRSGLSVSLKRGFWKLTGAGVEFARANPAPLAEQVVERLATDNHDVRLRPAEAGDAADAKPGEHTQATASPDDRLETALAELRQTVVAELLETMAQVSPQYFETIVLDLLHRMGYGASREDLQRVGGVGDGGIDGVISLDRLGLERVYVRSRRDVSGAASRHRFCLRLVAAGRGSACR
jgi:restriction system protein